MLVLSRKIGDRVVIDGGICVRVLSVNGGRVKLGVEAPDEVGITRGELIDQEPSPEDSSRAA